MYQVKHKERWNHTYTVLNNINMFYFQSALAAAFINIKIPIVLGELVNVLSNFSREEAQNILDEIKKPALKLVKYYCIQV